MRTVITYGTFDLFHVGHIRLLKRVRALGDRLIVGISSDEFNYSKGKSSFFSYEERSEILIACKYVDEVFPEESWEQKVSDIQKYDASIFAMGSDWEGKFDELNALCEVIYLPRTEDISSTSIKKKLSSLSDNKLKDLENAIHDVVDVVKSLKHN